jgi:hypothetical protein
MLTQRDSDHAGFSSFGLVAIQEVKPAAIPAGDVIESCDGMRGKFALRCLTERHRFSLPRDVNEDAFGSEAPQNLQNRAEVWCEYISLYSAQVASSYMGGSCNL